MERGALTQILKFCHEIVGKDAVCEHCPSGLLVPTVIMAGTAASTFKSGWERWAAYCDNLSGT